MNDPLMKYKADAKTWIFVCGSESASNTTSGHQQRALALSAADTLAYFGSKLLDFDPWIKEADVEASKR